VSLPAGVDDFHFPHRHGSTSAPNASSVKLISGTEDIIVSCMLAAFFTKLASFTAEKSAEALVFVFVKSN
jgi:hypothetical protein